MMADTVKDAVLPIIEKAVPAASTSGTGEGAPNLHLDEVTGERVSKSERR
jgi:hypothetical protein